MNGKFEERLARLAFGDLTPEETRELERQAVGNPEAARVLNEYRAMRDGLRDLGADVPPDQLSKERLRDAILAQGLRPQAEPAAAPNRGWLWMPVLAGALAFAVFTLRGGPTHSGAPTVVLNDAKMPPLNVDLPQPSLPSPGPSTMGLVAQAAPKPTAKPELKLARNSDLSSRSIRRPRARRTIILQDRIVEPTPLPQEDPKTRIAQNDAPKPPETDPVKTSANPEATVVAQASPGPIVLIDSSKDAQTGANNATEVGTASNVLVGG
jgi:hypothetical protein